MPCASYQCTSALRISPPPSRIRATPLSFSPGSRSELPTQPHDITNAAAQSNDFYRLDPADGLEVPVLSMLHRAAVINTQVARVLSCVSIFLSGEPGGPFVLTLAQVLCMLAYRLHEKPT